MNFDLQTKDTACKFLLNFMQMSKSEYLDEYVLKCDSNYEIFWDRNFQKIDSIDISNIRVIAFHVVGSLDDCAEIKETGLKNLQKLETEWIQQSKPYKVIFYSYLNQIDNSTFDINNLDDPPYVDWINLSYAQKIKKWMLGKAIARVNDSLPESYLYIKDNLSIPPNQIIDCVRI